MMNSNSARQFPLVKKSFETGVLKVAAMTQQLYHIAGKGKNAELHYVSNPNTANAWRCMACIQFPDEDLQGRGFDWNLLRCKDLLNITYASIDKSADYIVHLNNSVTSF